MLTLVIAAGFATEWCTSAHNGDTHALGADSKRLSEMLLRFDGQWYLRIEKRGYTYDPDIRSTVAFFPLYPLLGRLVRFVTRVPADVALLLVSNLCMIASLWLFRRYLLRPGHSEETIGIDCSLRAVVCYPTSFFFLMAYSESFFFLLTIAAMYSIRKHQSFWLAASIVGAATATRPVGVALLPPLLWHAWQTSINQRQFIRRLAFGVPISLSGILLYALFLSVTFGDPLAFARVQAHWSWRPILPATEKMYALISLEPFYAPYMALWPTHWSNFDSPNCIFASLQAANPVLFGTAILLVLFGMWNKWLTVPEFLLAAG
ncbi:MAG: hypothetical protein KDA87_21875, partial [Planctomycetales bacterium]|nr:hypothetical protein [Planctomycetales bacterium]